MDQPTHPAKLTKILWDRYTKYLEPFTKPMLAQRLEESGFAADYDKANGEKAFAKLANGKKGDLIDAVRESTFDFKGFLPEGLKLEQAE